MADLDSSTIKMLVSKLEGQVERNKEVSKYIKLTDNLIHLSPRATEEHRRLAELVRSPWAQKIVNSRVARLRTAGIRDESGSDDESWKVWRRWRMAQKEKTVFREAITYGDAYIELRRMKDGTTQPFPKSPFLFTAFYEQDSFRDAFNAEYPVLAMERSEDGKSLKVWDETDIIIFSKNEEGEFYEVSRKPHGADVVPIVRYANDVDSSGCSVGDIYPLRYTLARLMNVVYDSTVINHSNSWNVRYIIGLDGVDAIERFDGETDEEFARRTGELARRRDQALSTADTLTIENPDAKVGSLPATPPGSFIGLIEQALKELASLSNTPSEYLTGDVVAQSAEQSANSQKTFNSLIKEKKDVFSESHESLLRLHIKMTDGDDNDFMSTVVWDDDAGESIAAKVDALGKMATMLKIPVEELWEEIPGMTPEKLERYRDAYKLQQEREQNTMMAMMAMGAEDDSPAVIAVDNLQEG